MCLLAVLVLAACGDIQSGECNVVTQNGCASGEWCTWFPSSERCEPVEQCTSIEPGTNDVGEACTAEDRCRPGAACNPPGVAISDVCLEWCRDDEDCSQEGAECSIEATFEIPGCSEPANLPHRLCTIP